MTKIAARRKPLNQNRYTLLSAPVSQDSLDNIEQRLGAESESYWVDCQSFLDGTIADIPLDILGKISVDQLYMVVGSHDEIDVIAALLSEMKASDLTTEVMFLLQKTSMPKILPKPSVVQSPIIRLKRSVSDIVQQFELMTMAVRGRLSSPIQSPSSHPNQPQVLQDSPQKPTVKPDELEEGEFEQHTPSPFSYLTVIQLLWAFEFVLLYEYIIQALGLATNPNSASSKELSTPPTTLIVNNTYPGKPLVGTQDYNQNNLCHFSINQL